MKTKRLYDSVRWRKLRIWFLTQHPLCAMCLQQGIDKEATVVDHIKPHKGDASLFWDSSNHQSLCKQCHDSAKKIEEQHGVIPGCDINGMPLDKRHSWGKK